MYGEVELPDFVGELSETDEVQRLKGISQDSLPQECLPWKVPSRFEHGLGVCCLACLVVGNNHLSKRDGMLLQIAALLHDAGNCALSHLPEVFLRRLTGKDGESFLEKRLANSRSEALITRLGFDAAEVVRMVTGNFPPLSVVLNGSMDIDNLDNVGRYWFVAHSGETLFNAELIASSFQYNNGWSLSDDSFQEAVKWQSAREAVYGMLYGEPHLSAVMMGYRAVDIAFALGEIKEDFFHLNDMQAFEFLQGCNSDTSRIIGLIMAQRWHREIVSVETTIPSPKMKVLAEQWNLRSVIADRICEQCQIPKSAICVYFGKGKDRRRISLPFVGSDGSRRVDNGDHSPIYRIRVYLDPEFNNKREQVESQVQSMVL
jgi:HD superfamily phosphohydrolase